jgi:hypothetical protein
VAFVAEQLGVDAACFAEYGQRQQTVYEHAWEIRELLGYATSPRQRPMCGGSSRPGCGRRRRARGRCSTGLGSTCSRNGCCCRGSPC